VQLQSEQVQSQLQLQLEQLPQVQCDGGPEQFEPVRQLQWDAQTQLQFRSL
jgi:hypothetical protein